MCPRISSDAHSCGSRERSPIGGLATTLLAGAPAVLTARRASPRTQAAATPLLFRPVLVQKGRGPHVAGPIYATDLRGDAFHSDIALSDAGIGVSIVSGERRFAITVRWNVEGFGCLCLTADNGGETDTRCAGPRLPAR